MWKSWITCALIWGATKTFPRTLRSSLGALRNSIRMPLHNWKIFLHQLLESYWTRYFRIHLLALYFNISFYVNISFFHLSISLLNFLISKTLKQLIFAITFQFANFSLVIFVSWPFVSFQICLFFISTVSYCFIMVSFLLKNLFAHFIYSRVSLILFYYLYLFWHQFSWLLPLRTLHYGSIPWVVYSILLPLLWIHLQWVQLFFREWLLLWTKSCLLKCICWSSKPQCDLFVHRAFKEVTLNEVIRVRPNSISPVSLWEVGETSKCTHTKKRPCEQAAREGPPASRGERPQEKTNLPTPWS